MPSEPPPEIKIAIGDKIADGKWGYRNPTVINRYFLRYIVKKKLGEGSCGQVYLVHDKNENVWDYRNPPTVFTSVTRYESWSKDEESWGGDSQGSQEYCSFENG